MIFHGPQKPMNFYRTNKSCVGNDIEPENEDNIKNVHTHLLFNYVSTKTWICIYIYHINIYDIYTYLSYIYTHIFFSL